ncbi:hypothetical protein ACLOJK_015136 [Asimina triloba]
MLEGKAIISERDMLQAMQQHALQLAAKALAAFDVTGAIEIACYIRCIGSLAIMLFKGTALGPASETSPSPPMETLEARVFCPSPSTIL